MRTSRVLLLTARIGAITVPMAACEGDPIAPQVYELEVVNEHPHMMMVSYDDGSGFVELGGVDRSSSHVFEIRAPDSETITVRAVNHEQTHTVEGTVTLKANGTVTFTIMMEMDAGM